MPFDNPYRLATFDDLIYVADCGCQRVFTVNKQFSCMREVETKGYPDRIWIDKESHNLYVADESARG